MKNPATKPLPEIYYEIIARDLGEDKARWARLPYEERMKELIGSNDNSSHTLDFIIMGIGRLLRAIDNSNSANWLRTSRNRQGIRVLDIDQ